MNDNPLFEAYVREKLKDYYADLSETSEKWVRTLRIYYLAARKEGFTAKQSMEICDMLWRHVDEETRQRKNQGN